jgi:hypothetical protein
MPESSDSRCGICHTLEAADLGQLLPVPAVFCPAAEVCLGSNSAICPRRRALERSDQAEIRHVAGGLDLPTTSMEEFGHASLR